MRRWLITFALCITAIVLSASLLRYAENNILTHEDYSETRSIPEEPILTTGWSVMDFMCIQGQKCERALAVVKGIYPKSGVPFVAALFGGFIAPALLIITALAHQVRSRWMKRAALTAAALFLSLVMLDFTFEEIRFYKVPASEDVQHQISAEAIWITGSQTEVDWCMTGPPDNKCKFARVNGVFPRRGVSREVAVISGIAIPLCLFAGAIFLGIWPRRRNT